MMEEKVSPLRFSELPAVCPLGFPMAAVMAGIGAGRLGQGWTAVVVSFFLAAVSVAVILLISRRSPTAGMRMRGWYVLPVLLSFFGIGLGVWLLNAPPQSIPHDSSHAFCTARVSDYKSNASGDVVQADILYFSGADGSVAPLDAPVKVLLYTESGSLRRGEIVRFRNFLTPLSDPASPTDSYARAMYSRGVAWRQSVSPERLRRLDYRPSLTDRAADLRDRLVRFVEGVPLDEESRAFIEAVMLGDRGQLDPEVTESFASAGVAHLLALSGMHLGIVTMILSAALLPFAFFVGRRSRYLILLAGVWVFAFLTGMSVSVVRAAVMTSVFLLSMMVQRRRTGLNTLCGAALFILLADPVALFNIGFQLSFITCAALLALSGHLDRLSEASHDRRYVLVHSEWADRHPRLLWLRMKLESVRGQFVGACCVAIAAFAVSWILTACYFHKVSLMFLPANLVAGALVWLIFMAAAVYLPLCALGAAPTVLGHAIDLLCNMLGNWCELLSGIDGSAQYVSVDVLAVLAYMVAAVLFVMWLTLRRDGWLWSSVAAAAVALAVTLWMPMELPRRGLDVRMSKGEASVCYVVDGRRTPVAYLRGAVSCLDTPSGRVVVVDCDITELAEDETACQLLVIGLGGSGDAAKWIRALRPETAALCVEGDDDAVEEAAHSIGSRLVVLGRESLFLPY